MPEEFVTTGEEETHDRATERIFETTLEAYNASDEVGKEDLIRGAQGFIEFFKGSPKGANRAKIKGYEMFIKAVEEKRVK